MPHVRMYHNPRCSKSRQTLELLNKNNIMPEIIEYLEHPPTVAQLKNLLQQLNMPAATLIRRKEALFKTLCLENADDDTLINAMAANPCLIERPIVVCGQRAVLARPPETVLELIHAS